MRLLLPAVFVIAGSYVAYVVVARTRQAWLCRRPWKMDTMENGDRVTLVAVRPLHRPVAISEPLDPRAEDYDIAYYEARLIARQKVQAMNNEHGMLT